MSASADGQHQSTWSEHPRAMGTACVGGSGRLILIRLRIRFGLKSKCHSVCAREFGKAEVPVEIAGAIVDGVDDQRTGTGERGDFLSVLDGVPEQGCSEADALVPLVHAEHAEQDHGNLIRHVTNEPAAGHIPASDRVGAERVEPGNLITAERRVDHCRPALPRSRRAVLRPAVDENVSAMESLDSDAYGELRRLGDQAHSQTAFLLSKR